MINNNLKNKKYTDKPSCVGCYWLAFIETRLNPFKPVCYNRNICDNTYNEYKENNEKKFYEL